MFCFSAAENMEEYNMFEFLKMVFNREKYIVVLKYYVLKLAIENATLTGKLSRGDSVAPLAKQVEDMYKVHEAEMERTKALQQRYEDAIKQSNEIVDYVKEILANNGVDVSNL